MEAARMGGFFALWGKFLFPWTVSAAQSFYGQNETKQEAWIMKRKGTRRTWGLWRQEDRAVGLEALCQRAYLDWAWRCNR